MCQCDGADEVVEILTGVEDAYAKNYDRTLLTA
jgi:hypothetical protein